MYHRQTVDQDRHVITAFAFSGISFVLMDDLQAVLVDMLLVNQFDVLEGAVIADKD